VITGGSRGIGAAAALVLARRGRAVCVGYRVDADAAPRVVKECEAIGATAFGVVSTRCPPRLHQIFGVNAIDPFLCAGEAGRALDTGVWDERYGSLRTQDSYEGALRLVVQGG